MVFFQYIGPWIKISVTAAEASVPQDFKSLPQQCHVVHKSLPQYWDFSTSPNAIMLGFY